MLDLSRQAGVRRRLEDRLRTERENAPGRSYDEVEDAALTELARGDFYQIAEGRLSPLEREMLAAIRDGHRDNHVFAGILRRHGINENPEGQVKNVKAQLERALRGLAREHGYYADDLLG